MKKILFIPTQAQSWPMHYPLSPNKYHLWAANRKKSAFFCTTGRKSASLNPFWETCLFLFPLPWQSVMNWSLIWLSHCWTQSALSTQSPLWARDLPGCVIPHVPSVLSPPPTGDRTAVEVTQQEPVSHMSHSSLCLIFLLGCTFVDSLGRQKKHVCVQPKWSWLLLIPGCVHLFS